MTNLLVASARPIVTFYGDSDRAMKLQELAPRVFPIALSQHCDRGIEPNGRSRLQYGQDPCVICGKAVALRNESRKII